MYLTMPPLLPINPRMEAAVFTCRPSNPNPNPNQQNNIKMTKIRSVEYFRLPPRWLFVKITDEHDHFGWGEASLEGHTQAVEGCLDGYTKRVIGMDAE